MTWLYLGIFCASILILVIFLNVIKRKKPGNPAALAEQIIRFPERSLLDIPLFIKSIPAAETGGFLKETDNNIEQRGKFTMRRKFLHLFTRLIEDPSINSVKNFADFLFDDSSKDFRTTLRWDGRCNSALSFLKLIKVMSGSLEMYRSPGKIRKSFPADPDEEDQAAKNTLSGIDREIAKEWKRLLGAFYKNPEHPKKRKAKSKKSKGAQKRKSKKILLPETLLSDKSLPVSLADPEKVPYLLYFQKAAGDVLRQYRQMYSEQRSSKGKTFQDNER